MSSSNGKTTGLRQQLAVAKNPDQLCKLMCYAFDAWGDNMSSKTYRRCLNTAERRLKELEVPNNHSAWNLLKECSDAYRKG